jgi:hypothetical protein
LKDKRLGAKRFKSEYEDNNESESSDQAKNRSTKRKNSTRPKKPQSTKKGEKTPKKTFCTCHACPQDASLKGKKSGSTSFTLEELLL